MFFKQKKKQTVDYYIVGLGNPGYQYRRTRHNAGFDVLDILAQTFKVKKFSRSPVMNTARVTISDKNVLLVLPQTFMNNSGRAIKTLVSEYKAKMNQIIVVYDDVDIPLGAVRIKERGSAGTHNGMRSIVSTIKTDEFLRLRVGIGKNPGDIVDHVLSTYADDELEVAFSGYRRAADALVEILTGGVTSAQQKYN